MPDESTPIDELTPPEAKDEMVALRKDTEFMADYMDVQQRRDGHRAAVEKMRLLYQQAYPRAGQEIPTIEGAEEPSDDDDSEDAEAQATMASLRAQYGQGAEEVVTQAQSAVDKLGGQELRDALTESGKGDDVGTIKKFAELAKADERMPLIQVLREMLASFPDPLAAAEEIVRLQGDRDFLRAYLDTTGQERGHKLATAKMTALFQIKCGITDLGPPPDKAA